MMCEGRGRQSTLAGRTSIERVKRVHRPTDPTEANRSKMRRNYFFVFELRFAIATCIFCARIEIEIEIRFRFRFEAGVRPAPPAANRNRKGQKGLKLSSAEFETMTMSAVGHPRQRTIAPDNRLVEACTQISGLYRGVTYPVRNGRRSAAV